LRATVLDNMLVLLT